MGQSVFFSPPDTADPEIIKRIYKIKYHIKRSYNFASSSISGTILYPYRCFLTTASESHGKSEGANNGKSEHIEPGLRLDG
jgi:hypothetical protein